MSAKRIFGDKARALAFILSAALIILAMPATGRADDAISLDTLGIETGRIYEDIFFQDEDGKNLQMPCWVWIPSGATTHMPLTVFNHGSEQTRRKKNLPVESEHPKSSLPLAIKNGLIPLDGLNTILIAPHRSSDSYGTQQFIDVIEAAARHFQSDRSRIALTGFSWGGSISYDLLALRPDLFCVAFIASSGPERARAGTLKTLRELDADALPPIVTTISLNDRDFPYAGVMAALAPLGDKVQVTAVEEGHYEAAYLAYSDPDVQRLLFLRKDSL